MKTIVFLLVLANLLFYAFSTGLIGASGSAESVRIGQQLHPDRIRIVASGDAPPLAAAPADPVEAVVPAAQAGAPAALVPACLRWASVTTVEAERVGRVISGGFTDFVVARKVTSAEGSGWWVHMPPQPNRAAADKKAQELRALGVTDYFIVQEGAARHAISLGIFSTERGAQEHLAKLQKQGVRSARVGVRPDKEDSLELELRGPEERKALLLEALAAALPKNPPKDCQ